MILVKCHISSDTQIFPAQNNDGPIKRAKGPCPIHLHTKFKILMDLLNFFMGPVENLMGPRIPNTHFRAKLT